MEKSTMSSFWISCNDVITRERNHFKVDESVYVYIRQLEHRWTMAEKKIAESDRFKDTYFVCGEGGDRNENGLPESIFICPALGSDITVKYTRVD
jgi:hypothetical protein